MDRRVHAHVELCLGTLAERIGVSVEALRKLGAGELLQAFGEAVAAPALLPAARPLSGVWETVQEARTPERHEPMLERLSEKPPRHR